MNNAASWRLLQTGTSTAFTNMAIDEAVFDAYRERRALPTLRLYQWCPPGLSLGYAQPIRDVNWDGCREVGADVVRRPTGGRAILHDDEVTYSVVVGEDIAGSGVMESYVWISRGLVRGLQLLGVDAKLEYHVGRNRKADSTLATAPTQDAACFAKAARCDLVVNGKKIAGSAQMRRDGVILQHGSVPLRMHFDQLARVLFSRSSVEESATDVCSAKGADVTAEELSRNLVAGFASKLGIEFSEGSLTDWELVRAQELEATKYGTEGWNRHVP